MATKENAAPGSKLSIVRFILNYGIALVILVAYGFIMKQLFGQTAIDELEWTRSIWLFSSLEAAAFGALGYIFGREITKTVVQSVESDRDRAQEEAEQAETEKQDEREKGRILAALAKSALAQSPEAFDFPDESNAPRTTSAAALLVQKIEEYYPEV